MRGPTAAMGAVRAHRSTRTVAGVATTGVLALVALAGCGTGQIAQTAEQQPTIVGINGHVGDVELRNAMVEFPTGDSYPAGSNAALDVTLINSGSQVDQLVGASSSVAANVTLTTTPVGSSSTPSGPGNAIDGTPVPAISPTPTPTASKTASKTKSKAKTKPGSTSSPSPSPSPSPSTVSSVALPVNSLVTLDGSGEHIELGKLRTAVYSGDSVSVTFTFARAGSVTLDVPVATTPTYQPRPSFSPTRGPGEPATS